MCRAAQVSAAWQRVLAGGRVAAELAARGYAVAEGALGPELAGAARRELAALAAGGQLVPNASVFVAGSGAEHRVTKRGVLEAESHRLGEAARAASPTLVALEQDRTLPTVLNVQLGTPPHRELRSQALKLQRNEGGGACFPWHFDADAALDGRRVTVLLWLNPGWEQGDGGELVLAPPAEHPVTVAPANDRAVFFSAPLMLHRVLPSLAPERYCVTLWSFSRSDAPLPAVPPAGDQPGGLHALMHVSLRKHLLKLVHARDWARSLVEAHPPGEGRDAALEAHWKDVSRIEAALAERHGGDLDADLAHLRAGRFAEAFGGHERVPRKLDWLL